MHPDHTNRPDHAVQHDHTMRPDQLARYIDHTLLKPEATPDQIDRLCDEADAHAFASVFVNPRFVARAARRLANTSVGVGTVSGFPLGASHKETIVSEARRGIEDGATEIDMVVWVGGLVADLRRDVVDTIYDTACVVHSASSDHILKVILETRALTEDQIILGCRCAAEGEADFVKTSTGYHSSGGATPEHVRLLHRHAAPLKVKASAGIRTYSETVAMIDAGAARIGTSAAMSIMEEYRLADAGRSRIA